MSDRIQRRVPEMSPAETAWLACALDAEGTIYVTNSGRGRLIPRIEVTNTDPRFINKCHQITHVGFIFMKRGQKINWKPCWYWRSGSSHDIHGILRQVLPYLIIKKSQAEIVLTFIEMRASRTKVEVNALRNQLAALNQRGV